jgi:hypothetical protein
VRRLAQIVTEELLHAALEGKIVFVTIRYTLQQQRSRALPPTSVEGRCHVHPRHHTQETGRCG